ncbi:unnamed protein product [Urochloa decumbens]|uniref:SIAH-type domain-containing protein n=1 Tax=Urochloa decumbens TaxID=240449 RepID=A0ABC8W524_9POAL
MERLVESISFPCPNAVYGCTARATYYEQHCHHQECLHMPCHCPSKACGFVGSTAMLVEHFKAVHGWPCATLARAAATDVDNEGEDYYEFNVCLHDGFNFLLADCPTDGIMYLFLLNVESAFSVECTDLSDGLPSPDECFQFVVPTYVLAEGDKIEVGGQITIS